MYWSSLSTAANPAAAYQANPTGYAVGPSAAAGTYTAQRAQATYDSGYSAATSHASASYPTTPSTTYEYGYTAQRPSQPAAAAAAAAAAAVYDASKSYYSQNNAAAAVAATAATSYASSETSYPAAAGKGTYSTTGYSTQTQSGYGNNTFSAGSGPYGQSGGAAKTNTWSVKKGGPGTGNNRTHYKSKMPPRPQQLHYCDVCKISCAGPQTYREHLEGQKHKKKEQSVKTGPTPCKVGQSLHCELCDVTCTGADAYAAHIRGAKHQKVVKLHQKLGKPIPSDDPVVVGKTAPTTAAQPATAAQAKSVGEKKPDVIGIKEDLQELKEKDVEPVGQEYIEEIKSDENDPQGSGKVISFNCKLCDCKFNDPNAKEMHMKGRRHRLQYKKKVNPNLQVDVKTTSKQRKIHEDKLRKSMARQERIRRDEERMMEDDEGRWAWDSQEMAGYGSDWFGRFPRPPMGGPCMRLPFMPPHMMPMRRMETSDDRHALAKHAVIYPLEEELGTIQRVVSQTEKALKQVSDYLAELDAPKIKKEAPVVDDKADKADLGRVLKGVMRVGILAKGLLLRGDTGVQLVVLCAEKPTRTLLDRVADALPQHLQTNDASGDTYEVVLHVEEAAVQVVHPSLTVTITLTSPVMREQAPAESQGTTSTGAVKDAPDVLDKVKCLEALAALRHAKWFQARANGLQSCVMVIRIMRDFCQRMNQWNVLSSWGLELMVEKVIASACGPISPGDGLRRVFEAVACGILLPGAPGLYDPCEREPTDAAANLSSQEREEITASAQQILRLVAFRQIHKVLEMDLLPPPKFIRGPGRFNRKRRRDNSTSDANENDGSDGKKEKKEEEVPMETK